MLQSTTHHDGTTVPIVGPSWKFSRTPVRIRTPAPSLGEHNDAILAALGLGAEDIARLAEQGVI